MDDIHINDNHIRCDSYEHFLKYLRIENGVWYFIDQRIHYIEGEYNSKYILEFVPGEDGKECFDIKFWRGKVSNKATFVGQCYDLWHKKELKEIIKKIEYDIEFNALIK